MSTKRSSSATPSRAPNSSTPIKARISGSRRANSSVKISVPRLRNMIKCDLAGAIMTDVDWLIKDSFPSKFCGIHGSTRVSISATHTDDALKAINLKFPNWPMIEATEKNVCAVLNTIGSSISKSISTPLKRKWTSNYKDTTPEGGLNNRFPDILLYDVITPVGNITWTDIHTICEVTKLSIEDRVNDTQAQKTFNIFLAQDDRTKIRAINIFNTYFCRLLVFDRSGQLSTVKLDLREKKDSKIFIHAVAYCMFGSRESLGYDETMIRGTDGQIIGIWMEETLYHVDHKLFASPSLTGRATKVFAVHNDQGEKFIIKDCWCPEDRATHEEEIMRRIGEMENVTALVDAIFVKLKDKPGQIDRTARGSPANSGTVRLDPRVHRRMLMLREGKDISHFESRLGFIQVFLDIVIAHKGLCDDRRILHRDISIDNILTHKHTSTLTTPTSHKKPRPRGLLADFDYSEDLTLRDSKKRNFAGHRTGTLPYMAFPTFTMNLEGGTPEHTDKFDLESIFLVMLHMCCYFEGPNKRVRGDFEHPYNPWLDPPFDVDMMSLYGGRHIAFNRIRANPDTVMREHFTKYFSTSAPIMAAMVGFFFCLFPSGDFLATQVTHDSVISVLEKALIQLEEADSEEQDQPQQPEQSPLKLEEGNWKEQEQPQPKEPPRKRPASKKTAEPVHPRRSSRLTKGQNVLNSDNDSGFAGSSSGTRSDTRSK